MMQAAGRSYRLNQTHTHCKTYYLFAEGTMEQTAVQLMSRKQRAAKLLTGDIGLTGLDALTEGEGGFEQALLEAIGRDEALLDPSELFRKSEVQGEIDREDAAYWNVELQDQPLDAGSAGLRLSIDPPPILENDPLLRAAIQLGAVVSTIEPDQKAAAIIRSDPQPFAQTIADYLDAVHIIADAGKRATLQAKLLHLLTDGVQAEDGTCRVVGMSDPDFHQDPVHAETLTHHVRSWLKEQRFVFAGCEAEVAAHILRLAQPALGDGSGNPLELRPVSVRARSRKSTPSQSRRLDLLVVPGSEAQRHEPVEEPAPLQLALF